MNPDRELFGTAVLFARSTNPAKLSYPFEIQVQLIDVSRVQQSPGF
jgi:hypothetical protein